MTGYVKYMFSVSGVSSVNLLRNFMLSVRILVCVRVCFPVLIFFVDLVLPQAFDFFFGVNYRRALV